MTENEQKHLDELMDYYNFNKVASVMEHLQWKWFKCDCPNNVPDEQYIRAEVRKWFTRLIVDANNGVGSGQDRYSMCTGGFDYVVLCDYKGCVDALGLKFYVAEWSTFV